MGLFWFSCYRSDPQFSKRKREKKEKEDPFLKKFISLEQTVNFYNKLKSLDCFMQLYLEQMLITIIG